MLCQLVCTDRRYQRMNCFNIRELQGILKRRFFTDLVNSNDHRDLLDSTMIGLRYKTNGLNSIEPDMPMFFNLGTTNSIKTKQTHLNPYVNLLLNPETGYKSNFEVLKDTLTYYFSMVDSLADRLMEPVINAYNNSTLNSFKPSLRYNNFKISSFFEKIQTELTLVLELSPINLLQSLLITNPFTPNVKSVNTNLTSNTNTNNVIFSSELNSSNDSITEVTARPTEYTNMFRNLRFFNPLVSYDYKSGNYLGI